MATAPATRSTASCPSRRDGYARRQHLVTAQNQFLDVLDEIKGKPIMVAGVSEDAILGAMQAASDAIVPTTPGTAASWPTPPSVRRSPVTNTTSASVAQFPERFGRTVVPALVEAMAGAEVPSVLQAELQLVTAENVRQLFPDTPACDE